MTTVEITLIIERRKIRRLEGRFKPSRLYWSAPGLNIYVRGSLSGTNYERAASIGMQWCQANGIPTHRLRRMSK